MVWAHILAHSLFVATPGLATSSFLTHALAVTHIGLKGTARALIEVIALFKLYVSQSTYEMVQPKIGSSSECPRLRIPSSISVHPPSNHPSRVRSHFAAVAICAVNIILVYT